MNSFDAISTKNVDAFIVLASLNMFLLISK